MDSAKPSRFMSDNGRVGWGLKRPSSTRSEIAPAPWLKTAIASSAWSAAWNARLRTANVSAAADAIQYASADQSSIDESTCSSDQKSRAKLVPANKNARLPTGLLCANTDRNDRAMTSARFSM